MDLEATPWSRTVALLGLWEFRSQTREEAVTNDQYAGAALSRG